MAGITFEQLLRRSHWRLMMRTLLLLSLSAGICITVLAVTEQTRDANHRYLRELRAQSADLQRLLAGAPRPMVDRYLEQLGRQGTTLPVVAIGADRRPARNALEAFGLQFSYQQRLPSGYLQWVEDGQRWVPGPMRPLGAVPPHWQAALALAPRHGAVIEEPAGSPLYALPFVAGGLDTLLVPIEAGKAVAFLMPRHFLGNWGVAGVGAIVFLAVAVGGMLLLLPPALLAGYWQVKREARELSRPLAELTSAAQALQREHRALPVPPSGAQELQSLAQAFNAMAVDLDRAQTALEASRDALQRTLDGQRELFANVSHDLRTPLAAILGYAEILERDHPDLRPAAVIRREAANMARLVDDIFELARLESSHLTMHMQAVSLAEVARQAQQAFAKQAWDKGVLVRYAPSGHDDGQALADPQRLAQIVGNLVTNAVRHTQPGGYVELACGCDAGSPWISVTDSGPGIAREDLDRIFERSFRGDRARRDGSERRHAGLGLTIAQGLARAMGAELGVVSVIGQGSSFTLRLQAAHGIDT